MKQKQRKKTTSINDYVADSERRRFLERASSVLASGLALSSVSLGTRATTNKVVSTLSSLKNNIRGTVVERGTPHYEPWRQSMIWQYRKFQRYPDIIVQAETEDDVVAAINFARISKLKITTRSGGHSESGCYLRDGGVLLDVSRLQTIEIDARKRIAKVEAGVLGRLLNARLAEVGLAFPTAHCGMVPISGFLLGGGIGWNSTAWGGISVFNIVALDVVTIDGQRLHISEEANPDLFWAARGGGPGLFFTVTRFYLQCHPLPDAITTDTYIFHYSELLAVVELMDDLGPEFDPNLEVSTVVVPTPPDLVAKCKGSECDRVVVLSAIAFADTLEKAKTMLSSIANHGATKRALQSILNRPKTMEVLYQGEEEFFPQRRTRADNIYTNRAHEAAQVLSKHMLSSPSTGNTPVILWRGDLSFPDAAYSSTGRFYFAAYAQWDAAGDDIANQIWLKNLYDEVQPFASGYYINAFDRETRSAMTSACFAAPNWTQLKQLRQKYDPDGVFHDFLNV